MTPIAPSLAPRRAVAAALTAFLLTGAGMVLPDAPALAADNPDDATVRVEFPGSGTWTAPAGVTSIRATLTGGSGGNALGALGGRAGTLTTTLGVVPGTTYSVHVGTRGANGIDGGAAGSSGGGRGVAGRGGLGFSALGPEPEFNGGGGGGASSITRGGSMMALAAGGGGAGARGSGGAPSACNTESGGTGGNVSRNGTRVHDCPESGVAGAPSGGGASPINGRDALPALLSTDPLMISGGSGGGGAGWISGGGGAFREEDRGGYTFATPGTGGAGGENIDGGEEGEESLGPANSDGSVVIVYAPQVPVTMSLGAVTIAAAVPSILYVSVASPGLSEFSGIAIISKNGTELSRSAVRSTGSPNIVFLPALGFGTHALTVTFISDTPRFSGATGTLNVSVMRTGTTTTLTTDQGRDAHGAARTLIARVTPVWNSNWPPTGTVTLSRNGEILDTRNLPEDGVVTFPHTTFAGDEDGPLIATYVPPAGGTHDFATSASAGLTLESYVAQPNVSVSLSEDHPVLGTTVHVTVSVTHDRVIPRGELLVNFGDSHSVLATMTDGWPQTLEVPAEVTRRPGTYPVTAVFTSTNAVASVPSTAFGSLVVAPLSTTVSALDSPRVNAWGDPLLYPVRVERRAADPAETGVPPAAPAALSELRLPSSEQSLRGTFDPDLPVGEVQLLSAGEPLGDPVTLVDGTAVLDAGVPEPGTLNLSARYLGSADHSPSTGEEWVQIVTPATSRALLSAPAEETTLGVPLTVTATVDVDHPKLRAAGGSVTFTVFGADQLAEGENEADETEVPLSPEGTAALVLPAEALGTVAVTARYSGDGVRSGSDAEPLVVRVVPIVIPTPTPTPTASVPVGGTPSPSPTVSTGPSGSAEPTASVEPSASAEPSMTPKPSGSASPSTPISPRPTASATATASSSPSASPAPSLTGTTDETAGVPVEPAPTSDRGDEGALPGTGAGGSALAVLFALSLLLLGLAMRARNPH